MQQNNQEFSLNGVQLINPNLINYIPNDTQQRRNLQQQPFLYCSIPNLLLNQQGVVINQPNVLLNQSNFALNQQPNSINTLNQIYSNNQLLQTTNQQQYLANLYGGLNVIAPTNLIASPLINSTINSTNQKINKKNNSKTKKNTKSTTNKKRSKKKEIEEVRYIDEELSTEEDNYNESNQLNFEEEYNNFNEFNQQLNENNANTDEESDIEQSINEDNDFEMRDDLRLRDDDNLRQDYSTDEEENDDEDDDETINDDEDEIEENSNQMIIDDGAKSKKELKKKEIKEFFESLDKETRKKVEEIHKFAKKFKIFRKINDITQTNVSIEITRYVGSISQSKLCRFEQYAIDPTLLLKKKGIKGIQSALNTKNSIERYMNSKLERNLKEWDYSVETKTRKKRTNYPPKIVDILTNFFNQKTHPTNDDLIQLSKETNYKTEDIKVWFNNRRQSLKKSSFNYTKNGSETSSELN